MKDNFSENQSPIEEVDFNSIIAEIKAEILDPEEIKKYMILIGKFAKSAFDNCKEELDIKEFLAQFFEEYDRSLAFRGQANNLYMETLKYKGYREILKKQKKERGKILSLLRTAKQREDNDNSQKLNVNVNRDENIIALFRNLLRGKYTNFETEMIPYIQQEKNATEQHLISRMIEIIHESVAFLDEYGILDEYIKEANIELADLGLQRLSYRKRNPIPEEQYDINGKKIENIEDMGIIDSVEEDYLKKLPIDTLIIETAFWESKYWQNRIEISKAKAVIDAFDLWEDILSNGEEAILNLDSAKIKNALIKDEVLTRVHRKGIEITPTMIKQYTNFVEQYGLNNAGIEFNEEFDKIGVELANLMGAGYDVAVLQCLIIHQLIEKNPKVKRWGKMPNEEVESIGNSDYIAIAVEHEDLRGTMLLAISEETLKGLYNTNKLELPEYKKTNQIDEKYNSIMTKLCLLTTPYFRRVIKEEYKLNPYSPLLASLNGKSPKKAEGKGNAGDAR